jgi:hypothetical protein
MEQYRWIVDSWGDAPVTTEEAQDLCERAEAWLYEEGYDIQVRMVQRGITPGLYQRNGMGEWTLIQPPEELTDATNRAWEAALQS